MCSKANILSEKTDFLCSKMIKLLNQTKGNSINDCDFFKFVIYPVGGGGMQLLKLAAKIPSYTTGERNPLSNI
jgi:hypothetical protein